AFRGDEGRGKLRKAAGIGTHELIRRCPNGATRLVEDQSPRKRSKPGELKHLSTRRKRNRRDSVSSGERKRISPKADICLIECSGKNSHRG
ncbi:hypothetical protein SOVF_215730, partial [Spinacia oleracea]